MTDQIAEIFAQLTGWPSDKHHDRFGQIKEWRCDMETWRLWGDYCLCSLSQRPTSRFTSWRTASAWPRRRPKQWGSPLILSTTRSWSSLRTRRGRLCRWDTSSCGTAQMQTWSIRPFGPFASVSYCLLSGLIISSTCPPPPLSIILCTDILRRWCSSGKKGHLVRRVKPQTVRFIKGILYYRAIHMQLCCDCICIYYNIVLE